MPKLTNVEVEVGAKIWGVEATAKAVSAALENFLKRCRDSDPKVHVVDSSRVNFNYIDTTGAVVVDLSVDNPEIPPDARGEDAGKIFVHLRLPDGSAIPVYEELGWRHAGYPSDANIGVAGRYVGT